MTRRTIGGAKSHSASTLDGLLEEEDILGEVEAVAIKRMIAWQLVKTVKQKKITKKAMAARILNQPLSARSHAEPGKRRCLP
jgi:hypothetical protein